MHEIVAIAIFVVVLALIATEALHRTVASLLGAMLLIVLGIVGQERAAAEFIDWNVIGLLAGMMMIVGILQKTGVFEYLAIRSAQWGRARPGRIMVLLALVTAVLSAFLDNVTTVILMIPVTFLISDALGVSPVPLVLTQVMASNIGGAATLIGDPPNILVGSAAGLSFNQFILNMTPAVALALPPALLFLYLVFRGELKSSGPEARETVANMNARGAIRDGVLLRRSLLILALVVAAFFLHGVLHLQPATIALFGAAALVLYSGSDIEEVLHRVEWPTLLFFAGLFVMVGGLEITGVIGQVAGLLIGVSDNLAVTAVVVMWGSALASGVVDNIPFTAAMIPVLNELASAHHLSVARMEPLWWALTLGADFGGNATLIGASANVVAAGMIERSGGKVTFLKFMLYGLPVMLITVGISTAYVLLRYF